jgi:ABC-2 type transport system ATP-binding protein
VRDLILHLSGQELMTVFMNSHHLAEVERVCSKVAILHQGSIRTFDTLDRLRARPGQPQLALALADPVQTPATLKILTRIPGVTEAGVDGGRILVTLAEGSPAAPVLTRLVQEGIGIEEVTKISRSLEEIYLRVVQEA